MLICGYGSECLELVPTVLREKAVLPASAGLPPGPQSSRSPDPQHAATHGDATRQNRPSHGGPWELGKYLYYLEFLFSPLVLFVSCSDPCLHSPLAVSRPKRQNRQSVRSRRSDAIALPNDLSGLIFL